MRDSLAPIVEGVDFSGFVNRYSFECEPFFIDAAESATMLDGSTVHDVFPVRARFSWKLNSLSAEQYAALNAAFDAGATRGTVSAQIFDPTINAVRSAQFHVTRPAFVFSFTARDHMSTAGSVLTLEDAAPRTLSAVTPAPRQSVATRDPLAPVIEGFDLSGIVNRWSFQCEPFQTEGNNGGTFLDGSTVRDVLADKVRLSWRLNAISAQRYADLCAVLGSGSEPDTVSAIVFNPATNTRYTTTFHVTLPVFRFAFDNGQCMAYADSALVLEETGYEKITFPIMGNDYTLYDDGTLEIDPLPDGSAEPEVDRWNRILDDLDSPDGTPVSPIRDVGRIVLKPGIPSLPSGVLDKFPNLEEIVIPPDVEIAPDAFDNCPNLTIIKIVSFPRKSDYSVGDALDYAGLSVVEISGGMERDITPDCVLIPAEGYTTLETGDIMVDIRYHDKSLSTFWVAVTEQADYWRLEDDGTLYIYCVGNMPAFGSVSTSIPWYNYRLQIKSVAISDSVTSISDIVFEGCTNLDSVTIPDSVTSIGGSVFRYCTNLASVTIPDSVTSIGGGLFWGCTNLASVTIPDSVTSIEGNYLFSGCKNLKSVTLPHSANIIGGYWMFQGCTNLSNITLPQNTYSIGEGAFLRCKKLTSIVIPSSVTTIGDEAFGDCNALTDVYYDGTESQWNAITKGSGNTPLTSATIHYNSSPA